MSKSFKVPIRIAVISFIYTTRRTLFLADALLGSSQRCSFGPSRPYHTFGDSLVRIRYLHSNRDLAWFHHFLTHGPCCPQPLAHHCVSSVSIPNPCIFAFYPFGNILLVFFWSEYTFYCNGELQAYFSLFNCRYFDAFKIVTSK